MKLDNRGWGLQELIFGIAILFFSLALVSILISNSFSQIMPTHNGVEQGGQNNYQEQGNTTGGNQDVEASSHYTSYFQIEQAMVQATKQYCLKIYGDTLLEGDKISVTMKSLIRDSYLQEIHDIKDSSVLCSGYVTFIKEADQVIYTPYLKCGKRYTTKGYLERLDADMK